MGRPKQFEFTVNDVELIPWRKNTFYDFKHNGQFIPSFRQDLVQYNSIANRLYSGIRYRIRTEPLYAGVIDGFGSFQAFAEWHSSQLFCRHEGYEVDKDLLHCGEVISYSPNSCCLIPSALNTAILESDWNAPFCKTKQKYLVQMKVSFDGVQNRRFYGWFADKEEANNVLLQKKIELMRGEIAEFYKDKIDPRAYDALKIWVPRSSRMKNQ